MRTKAEILLTQAAIDSHKMRDKLEGVRQKITNHISELHKEIRTLDETVQIKYTGFMALLKKTDYGWECLRIVDTKNLPDEIEDEWDVSLPIPEPESMPEFRGW